MRKLRFNGMHANNAPYNGPDSTPWPVGEVRSVDAVEAASLLSDFGDCFTLVPDLGAVAPTLDPQVTRSAGLTSPETVGARLTSAPDLSGLSGPKLKAALATGEHDAHLASILSAELAGDARIGHLKTIRSRMA